MLVSKKKVRSLILDSYRSYYNSASVHISYNTVVIGLDDLRL